MAAAFEVYREMGNGYTEDIYQESLELELAERQIAFQSQASLSVRYKGKPLRHVLRPDMLVCGDMVVELKAATTLTSEHEAQLLNYLNATNKPVGYLVNFGSKEKLQWRRFARTRHLSAN